MAQRQKSFFEQDAGKKGKNHQWRTHKRPPQQHSTLDHNRKAMPSVPITASSQSRTKLKAFHFIATSTNTPTDENKPGYDPTAGENDEAIEGSQGLECPGNGPNNSSQDDRREYPQTPIGRVPLSELISNGEDAFQQAPDLTPVERVLWNNSSHSSDQFSNPATPIRRGKKRAHSSSPQPSSQTGTSNHPLGMGGRPAFDLQVLHQSLRTPKADPAGDLWSRYSLDINDKRSPSGFSAPGPVKFMESSSPQTPAKQLLESGHLRRSLSCGTEWPTSAAKRRKIQKSNSHVGIVETIGDARNTEDNKSATRLSRVSFLLEKVHDEMSRSPSAKGQPQAHSRSSPLDSKVATGANLSASAVQTEKTPLVGRPLTAQQCPEPISIQAARAMPTEPFQALVDGVSPTSASSDFGDDEIDVDLLEAVDASAHNIAHQSSNPNVIANQCVEIEPKAGTGCTTPMRECKAQPHHTAPICENSPPILKMVEFPAECTNIADDFDIDEDYFGADLENVVAMYDQRVPPEPMTQDTDAYGDFEVDESTLQAAATVSNDNGEPGGVNKQVCVELSSEHEYGDDFDFEQIAVNYGQGSQGATKSDFEQTGPTQHARSIQRYLIKSVAEGEYETKTGQLRPEKVLHLQEDKTKASKAVILRNSWFESPCTPGSYVHVIGTFDHAGQCTVDDSQNMIILHPDHLISATVVADSFSCTRRAVLQDRVKATNEANGPQVYGHILHEIFQEAMKANRWDTKWLTVTIQTVAARYLETLFEINVEMVKAVEHLSSKVPELQAWAELFVTARPKEGAYVQDRHGAKALMSVNKLLDVEEHVWSPMYGLKGNIDATVQVVMKDGANERTLTVPFEVKTGKNNTNAAHKAQTALYTLLLSDRYDIEIAYGILYYMETSEISRIPSIRHELRHMVMQRNELACYVRHRLELPPMLKSPHLCGKCYAKLPCFIYHKLVDDGNGETSGLKEKFDEIVRHLTPGHAKFFKNWDDLLTKEETDILKFRRELWTMLSSEREKVGRCFGNVVIEPGSALEMSDAPKINKFRYTFIKSAGSSNFSFTESQITVGEPIVISDEKGHFALANGYVTNLRKKRITVAVDRRLHNARIKSSKFDENNCQSFVGIMEIVEQGNTQQTLTPLESEEQVLYRLDKDEFSNGMATVRNNLIRVMERDLFGAQALRRLVIDGVAPTFAHRLSYTLPETASQADLNVDQRAAIEKVMSAKDYALVLGMPGTGKTTTIAHIIRALASRGKSILLTSYTHTAVDNILLKIRKDNLGILRIGAVAKVHPEVQEFAHLAGVPKTTMEELKTTYGQQIVATTCLGINHPIFNQRIFDYCIVDEASQITLPVCLGPIRMARTFILVGDHYQLPPLVQNKEAQEGGLDISLFKLLSEQHPSCVVNLEHQYRMCEDIMTLSNTLIYSGRLKCGTISVSTRSLIVPDMSRLKIHHFTSTNPPSQSQSSVCLNTSTGPCWLRNLLDSSVKVSFINTDPLVPLSREIARGSRITNPVEATLVTQLVESLITVGVTPGDIGVITLYRSQLALLKQNLRSRTNISTHKHETNSDTKPAVAVEMHTADKFQGRDKEVVILSLVRNNEAGTVGELLQDWRRVNVALTRARSKLLIVGSRKTLRKGSELLAKFMDLVEDRGWRFDFPIGGLESHWFEDGATPATGSVNEQRLGNGKTLDGEVEIEVAKKVVMTDGKENSAASPRKTGTPGRVPEKRVGIDGRHLLDTRPILKDIVNDAMG